MRNNITQTYDFLVSIIGNAPYGILTINLDGVITISNKLILEHLGISKKPFEVIEKPFVSIIPNLDSLVSQVDKCIREGREKFNIAQLIVGDRTISIKGRKILNGMLITTGDITSTIEQERKVLSAIIAGQEEERKRLAKEIHDGIGPLLSTIKLNVDGIKADLPADSLAPKTNKKLENVHELIQNVSTDIRHISHALMPSALAEFGLIAALENLILKINDANDNTDVIFFHSGFENRLDKHIELGLYRISQELLNNAIKYSQAKEINIQLILSQRDIVLVVEDDGKGFDLDIITKGGKKGIGLDNLSSRVKALDGNMEIDTQPKRGCTTTVILKN